MARRRVTHTRKDSDGDILALCDPGEDWSSRLKNDAIRDIEHRDHECYVRWDVGKETDIEVVEGGTGKYLRTDRDATTRNNLDDLPDC